MSARASGIQRLVAIELIQQHSTPILDRRVPLPPSVPLEHGSPWYGIVPGAAIVLVLAVAFEYGLTAPAEQWIEQWFSGVLPAWPLAIRLTALAVAALAGLLAALGAHELGHVVAGLCLGFRFESMRLGRLHLTRPFRLSWSRPIGRGAAGAALLIPVGTHRLRLRAFGMLAGGPAANFAAAAAVAGLVSGTAAWSGTFALCSIIVGAVNLVPFRSGAFVSDGKRLLTLLLHPAEAQRWLAMLALISELNKGVEPESLSADHVALATALRDESYETVLAHLLAYTARLHQHDDAGAGEALELCLSLAEHVPDPFREQLKGEAAMFQARRRARVDLAEAWLADIPRDRADRDVDFMNVEAAILEAKGDLAGARRTLQRVEMLLEERHALPLRDVSLRLLRRWKSELDEKTM